uniref:DUF4220 domain-containing protein n=1 Tax=Heligmosomoides polygyrus TaxID=6339 RepID=A0A8L8JUS7_HELPZ
LLCSTFQFQLYPIPILNNLIRSATGTYLNQLPRRTNNWVLTRRFFLIDDVSLLFSNLSRTVRYAKDVQLHFQDSRDGLIFPPFISIEYAETNENDSAVVQRNEKLRCILTRIDFSWSRRSGKASLLDASTVLQFLLYECAALGDVFFVVLTAMSCWMTFGYKSQAYPFYSVLNEDQEWVLMAYLIATACLKFISMVHSILHMILQETFFIDWERPQDSHLSRPISRDVTKDRKEIPVVVWRTYFVANEWAELRCVRATSVGLQMLIVLMIAVLRIHENDTICCSYLLLYCCRPLTVAVVERMITDPFHNFIDLCSIANIRYLTDLILDDDLCGFRGLEPSSHLQTFTVSLPVTFRTRYDEIMTAMKNSSAQVRLSGLDQTTAKIASTVRAHEQMNTLFREFIDHSIADMDYIIKDRSFAEALLDTELNDTTQTGNFLRDPSEVGFSECFLYGREWAHFSFEATLFVVLFLCIDSLTLTAAIVFCVSYGISAVTALLCKNHLVRSSLVDDRFLI